MRKIVEEEIERLRSIIRPDPESFAKQQEMHRRHVEAFAQKLHPVVEEALRLESGNMAANEWLNDAEAIVQWLCLPDQPGSKSRWKARGHLKKQLMQALMNENLGQPGREEVEEHATELAQLLLSNWFALLEHALQDRNVQEPVPLAFNTLPPGATPEALIEGVEAFVLSKGEAAKALLDYQTGLMDSGDKVLLSPIICLFKSDDGWLLCRPEDVAVNAPAPSEVMTEARAVMQSLSAWTLTRPLDLLPYVGDIPRSLTAGNMERIALVAAGCIRHDSPEFDFLLSHMPDLESLKTAVVDQIAMDIKGYTKKNWTPAESAMPLHQLGGQSLDVDSPDPGDLYRVALSTTAITLATDMKESVECGSESMSWDEKKLVALSVDIARQTATWSNVKLLGVQIRQAAGIGGI